jgi:hypothetical protein
MATPGVRLSIFRLTSDSLEPMVTVPLALKLRAELGDRGPCSVATRP